MSNYKIISFNESAGSIVVEFDPTMANLAIDVPLNNEGLFITGEELDAYIKGFIPTWHIERMQKLSAGVPNANEIASLVETVPVEEEPNVPMGNEVTDAERMWQQYQIEKQIAQVLVKFGVLATDPTEIPVSQG